MLLDLKTNSVQQKRWSNFLKYLSFLFMFCGIVLRLSQYLNNRSFWFDEVSLALNIVERSYGEFTQTLDYNQAAPLGFLWLEKLATQIFGENEYAMRLFPLISGIVSIFAFYELVRRYSSTFAAPMAIALFAFGRYTLYYATELKQYSSDVAIVLILCLCLIPIRRHILETQQIIGLSLLGGLSIWFCHPAIFALAGLECGYLITSSSKQRQRIVINRIAIYLTWIVSFSLFYFVTITNTLKNADLASSWESRYPDSFFDIIWAFDALGRFFYKPMGFYWITDAVGMVAFVFGCIACYRLSRDTFIAMTAPFVATLIASYLHKYPFRERLVLFLAPLAMLLVAEGLVFLLAKFSQRSKYGLITGIIGLVFSGALLIPTISHSSQFIIHPEFRQEMRPALEYIAAHDQPGDSIYVYYKVVPAFNYYVRKFNYSEQDYILGDSALSRERESSPEELKQFGSDLEPLYGKQRVWFVLRAGDIEEATAVRYMDQIGKQIGSFKPPGIFVYLYDLSSAKR
jgi:uncharacterized membrane protein